MIYAYVYIRICIKQKHVDLLNYFVAFPRSSGKSLQVTSLGPRERYRCHQVEEVIASGGIEGSWGTSLSDAPSILSPPIFPDVFIFQTFLGDFDSGESDSRSLGET